MPQLLHIFTACFVPVCEHCCELLYVSFISGDPHSSSLKPFDLLGTEGSSGGGSSLFSNLLSSPYPSTRKNIPY